MHFKPLTIDLVIFVKMAMNKYNLILILKYRKNKYLLNEPKFKNDIQFYSLMDIGKVDRFLEIK